MHRNGGVMDHNIGVETVPKQASSPDICQTPGFRGRILVVDDDRPLSNLIKRVLVKERYEVLLAGSGRDALEFIRNNTFDLLLLDYRISDMTGSELLQMLTECKLMLPFISITGYGDEKVAVEMMKFGAIDYLVKDMEFMTLLPGIIKQAMQRVQQQLKLQKTERALKVSENVYRTIFESNSTATIIVDQYEMISLANSQFEKLTGYAKKEVQGRVSAFDLMHNCEHKKVKDWFARTRIDDDHTEYEGILVSKGGMLKDVLISVNMIPDSNRSVVSFLDITLRKQAEQQELEHKEKIARISRINTVTALGSGLAHELNQPLSAIMNFVGGAHYLLKSDTLQRDKLNNIFEEVARQAERASNIIRRLHTFSRQKTPQMQLLNLNVALQEAAALLQPQLCQNNVRVVYDVDEYDCLVYADPIQLEQLILILFSNALDAVLLCPEGERAITISTGQYQDDSMVAVSITDTGPGMDTAVLKRSCSMFYSTKHDSLGIGLPVAQYLAEGHGGKLWLDSQDGKGTTSIFVLPVEGVLDDEIRTCCVCC